MHSRVTVASGFATNDLVIATEVGSTLCSIVTCDCSSGGVPGLDSPACTDEAAGAAVAAIVNGFGAAVPACSANMAGCSAGRYSHQATANTTSTAATAAENNGNAKRA